MKKLINQILKFGVVGIVCFLIEYILFIVCTRALHLPLVLSNIIATGISIVCNYILSVLFVFKVDKEQSRVRRFIIFVILSIGGMLLNTLILWALTPVVSRFFLMLGSSGFWALIAKNADLLVKVFATAVVMVYNFVTRKIFIEKHEKRDK